LTTTFTSKSSPSTAPNSPVMLLVQNRFGIRNDSAPEAQWEWLVIEDDFAVTDCAGQI
jgi:hypothetical protein